MRFLPDKENLTVAVIGLGYVGSCVAGALIDEGFGVIGVDTDAELVEELSRGYCRFQEPGLPELVARWAGRDGVRWMSDYSAVGEADVVIVAVGTPILDGGALGDAALRAACDELGRRLRAGQLVVFKSTVPPGATRTLALPLLAAGGLEAGSDFGVAFCPERLSQGAALRELRSLPVVVGGMNEDSAAAARHFWRQALEVEVITCASLEAAEVVKLTSNWWIDHNIALANELAKLCSALDVDVLEVIEAANSIPKGGGRINVLRPGVGVGGSCLTKDPWMLWNAARSRGIDVGTIPAAREANDGMPGYTVELVVEELRALGREPASAKVAILGLAFKNDTGDLRSTPVEPVVSGLRSLGAELSLLDPLVSPDNAEKVFGTRPSATVEEAVENADCLAILAWHKEFEDMDFKEVRELVAPACAIVDGRAYFPKEKSRMLQGLGFTYRGIGW